MPIIIITATMMKMHIHVRLVDVTTIIDLINHHYQHDDSDHPEQK